MSFPAKAMLPAWLKTVSDVAVGLSFLCTFVIVGDIIAGRRRRMAVMNLVWPVTALYLGPVGLLGDGEAESRRRGRRRLRAQRKAFLTDGFRHHQPPRCGEYPGRHHRRDGPLLHRFICFGSKLYSAFLVDFLLAYLFGIIFQFFTIAPMRNLGVWGGLVSALKADTVSLIAFEVVIGLSFSLDIPLSHNHASHDPA